MLREDGIVMDDGTTTRISENHYHMTTTTAQAANVLSHLEYYLQLVWPDLNVNVVSTTEQWAGAAIAGPKSRDLLQKLFPNSDVSKEGLPFMGYMEADLSGVKARMGKAAPKKGKLGMKSQKEKKSKTTKYAY